MRADLSILGLYEYDQTLFDNFDVPWYNTYDEDGNVTGTVRLDRTTLVDNLVTELAELEVLYPDPDIMKRLIGAWSTKMVPGWCKIFGAMSEDYKPLENYNRRELYEHEGGATNGDTAETINRVNGYNENSMSESDRSNNSSGSWVHNDGWNRGYVHGNIGVTTSQRMLEQEIAIRKNNNIFDIIISDFKKRFCLLVY